MTSVVDKLKFDRGIPQQDAGVCCEEVMKETAKSVEKGIKEMKTAVTTMMEDGKVTAERLSRHTRYAMEDGVDKTSHAIKQHPLGAVGIAFASGIALGLLVSLPARR